MITGAHSIIYSKNPEADRAFLRDVLQLTNVDVGHGWLIFGLPPAEVAVHPSEKNDLHEFYLMCDDVEAFVAQMKKSRVACGPVRDLGWGLLSQLTLPGGGKLGVYQPRHARPKPMSGKKAARKPAKRASPKRLDKIVTLLPRTAKNPDLTIAQRFNAVAPKSESRVGRKTHDPIGVRSGFSSLTTFFPCHRPVVKDAGHDSGSAHRFWTALFFQPATHGLDRLDLTRLRHPGGDRAPRIGGLLRRFNGKPQFLHT